MMLSSYVIHTEIYNIFLKAIFTAFRAKIKLPSSEGMRVSSHGSTQITAIVIDLAVTQNDYNGITGYTYCEFSKLFKGGFQFSMLWSALSR